ncbi:MAG TPA: aldo/keto reductase [Anaerolineales bacterium]|nr:aldo/keto reductase [Anaerolineales bacterium]
MEYRKLGNTDLKVSALCMGTMQFGWTADETTSLTVLDAAYQAGVTFIDTADIYSRWVDGNPGGVSEQIIGNWLKKSSIPRDKLVIATKVRGQISDDPQDQGLSRRHIFKAVESSLRRMDIETIDLYQSHWPDDVVPIEETLRAYEELIQQGKVRYIGCSNYSLQQLKEALKVSEDKDLPQYAALQPHYNLVHRKEFERELAGLCQERGLGVIPYSPLASGFLTGKYRKGQPIPENSRGKSSSRMRAYFTDKNWALLDKMENMGQEKGGYSISQVALAWQLANPVITAPIIGPKNLTQLNDNLGAVDVHLTEEEVNILNQASE